MARVQEGYWLETVMRKFASVSVLILVAYAAGTVRHFNTDKVVAFVAPVVPCVIAAGDAVWSAVRPAEYFFTAHSGPYIYAHATACVLFFGWLGLGVIWAFVSICTPKRSFFSAVEDIWNSRPAVGDQRIFPLYIAIITLIIAIFEFGARLWYFAGFTVVTLFAVPLKALKGLLTFDLSRPLRCLAVPFVVGAIAVANFSSVASASGIRVGMKVETRNATNTGWYPAEIIHIFKNTKGLVELKFAITGRCLRYVDEFRAL